MKKKFDLIEKKKSPTTEQQAEDTEDGNGNKHNLAQIISNAVANAVKPLQERLEAYERGDIAKSRLQAVSEKLNGCKDEVFKTKVLKDFNRMRFDTDEAFAEYLTDTEKDIQHANQRLADTNLTGHGKPMFAQKNESGISTGVAQFVEAQTKGAASLGGKEV